MIIVGAGHIAAPLHHLAALCDFRVTIIDDRPDFANRQRFPQAQTVIAADIRQTVREMAMDEDTYVVLVTRGHSLDVACLLEILDRPLAYIGMIGSQRRVRAVFDLLEREQGIPRAQLARVYTPIGLPIAAQTPAEIAVSIMAEVINILRGGRPPPFRASGSIDLPGQPMNRPVFMRLPVLSGLALFLVALLALLVWLFLGPLPDLNRLDTRRPAAANRILDRNGLLLYEVIDPAVGKHTPVALEQIAKPCRDATVAVEDKRFYQHPGVDLIAIARSAWANWRGGG